MSVTEDFTSLIIDKLKTHITNKSEAPFLFSTVTEVKQGIVTILDGRTARILNGGNFSKGDLVLIIRIAKGELFAYYPIQGSNTSTRKQKEADLIKLSLWINIYFDMGCILDNQDNPAAVDLLSLARSEAEGLRDYLEENLMRLEDVVSGGFYDQQPSFWTRLHPPKLVDQWVEKYLLEEDVEEGNKEHPIIYPDYQCDDTSMAREGIDILENRYYPIGVNTEIPNVAEVSGEWALPFPFKLPMNVKTIPPFRLDDIASLHLIINYISPIVAMSFHMSSPIQAFTIDLNGFSFLTTEDSVGHMTRTISGLGSVGDYVAVLESITITLPDYLDPIRFMISINTVFFADGSSAHLGVGLTINQEHYHHINTDTQIVDNGGTRTSLITFLPTIYNEGTDYCRPRINVIVSILQDYVTANTTINGLLRCCSFYRRLWIGASYRTVAYHQWVIPTETLNNYTTKLTRINQLEAFQLTIHDVQEGWVNDPPGTIGGIGESTPWFSMSNYAYVEPPPIVISNYKGDRININDVDFITNDYTCHLTHIPQSPTVAYLSNISEQESSFQGTLKDEATFLLHGGRLDVTSIVTPENNLLEILTEQYNLIVIIFVTTNIGYVGNTITDLRKYNHIICILFPGGVMSGENITTVTADMSLTPEERLITYKKAIDDIIYNWEQIENAEVIT